MQSDYAINSAGIVVGGSAVTLIKDTNMKDYERIQLIDGRGVFLCMKYQLQAMLKQDVPKRPRASRGVIVNLASRASLEGVVRTMCLVSRYPMQANGSFIHSQSLARTVQPNMQS